METLAGFQLLEQAEVRHASCYESYPFQFAYWTDPSYLCTVKTNDIVALLASTQPITNKRNLFMSNTLLSGILLLPHLTDVVNDVKLVIKR